MDWNLEANFEVYSFQNVPLKRLLLVFLMFGTFVVFLCLSLSDLLLLQ